MTTSASGSWVCRSGSGLGPHSPTFAVFAGVAAASRDGVRWFAPRELHLSLRAPSLPPGPCRARSVKTTSRVQAPLLRFLAPPAPAVRSVHCSRPCLSRSVPTPPFLTTSPACSASNPPGISPGHAHGVCALQGFSRSTEDRAVSAAVIPSWPCRSDSRLTGGVYRGICLIEPMASRVSLQ